MTDAEQERIIGADFKAMRNAERKLACLESKRAVIKRNIELMSRIFDRGVVVDSVSGNTLHTHDGSPVDRKHQAIAIPRADEIFSLIKEISNTQREISEIEDRLSRV